MLTAAACNLSSVSEDTEEMPANNIAGAETHFPEAIAAIGLCWQQETAVHAGNSAQRCKDAMQVPLL